MKKFLSMALALVMTMSLVVVGAGAKDFTDDSKIVYDKAVAVISEAGIVDGYTDGSFNPTGTLTRGAAAKIICNMILGPTTAEALSADAAPFKDVPANHVFAGYIAYCSQQGIINGYADGTFKPAGTLTGYQFMKMLLGALGYDGKYEGFTGANWSINVAKLALNVGLDDGNDDFVGTKAVTREEACLYAFNTLEADMVEYDENTQIIVGDIVINTSSKASKVINTKFDYKDRDADEDGIMQFVEKYFKDLTAEPDTDSFGRPATKWLNDGEKIGTYADDADDTLLVEKSNISVTTALTGTDYLNLKNSDVATGVHVYINGEPQGRVNADGEVTSWTDKDDITLYAGDFLETFENSDDKVETVVVTRYSVAKIDTVEDELSKDNVKKGATYAIDLEDLNDDFTTAATETLYDKHDNEPELKGFDAKTYVKDAVLAIVYGEEDVLASNVAETVEGKITAYTSKLNSSDGVEKASITLDGTKYPVAGTVQDVTDGLTFDYDDTEYTLYLDPNGYVIGVEGDTSVALDDVYVVTGYWTVDGKWGDTSYVEAVAITTGEVKEFVMGDADDADDDETVVVNGGELYTFNESKGKYFAKAYDLEENDDKVEALTGSDLDIELTKSDSKYAGYYFDDDTKFVKVEADLDEDNNGNFGGNASVKTATGSTSVDVLADNAYVFFTKAGKTYTATYVVIVADEINAATSAEDIVYFSDDSTSSNKDGYVGEAYFMDGTGSIETITYKKDDGKAIGGKFFSFSVDDDGIYDLDRESTELANGVYKDLSNKTGFVTGAWLTNVHKNALSAVARLSEGTYLFTADDIDLGKNVIVIDERTSTQRDDDVYKTEITSVTKLAAAIDKADEVVATVFYDDKEVIFVAVTAVSDAD